MIVEEDITAAVKEHERRERPLEQLIETLITIADRRDPLAANHSAQVAVVASDVAAKMGLEPGMARTAELAGRPMNLGKLLVPAEVLNFAGPLEDARMKQVRAANAFIAFTSDRAHHGGMDAAAAMMSEVRKSFERRVVAALLNLINNWGNVPAWAEPSTAAART